MCTCHATIRNCTHKPFESKCNSSILTLPSWSAYINAYYYLHLVPLFFSMTLVGVKHAAFAEGRVPETLSFVPLWPCFFVIAGTSLILCAFAHGGGSSLSIRGHALVGKRSADLTFTSAENKGQNLLRASALAYLEVNIASDCCHTSVLVMLQLRILWTFKHTKSMRGKRRKKGGGSK